MPTLQEIKDLAKRWDRITYNMNCKKNPTKEDFQEAEDLAREMELDFYGITREQISFIDDPRLFYETLLLKAGAEIIEAFKGTLRHLPLLVYLEVSEIFLKILSFKALKRFEASKSDN